MNVLNITMCLESCTNLQVASQLFSVAFAVFIINFSSVILHILLVATYLQTMHVVDSYKAVWRVEIILCLALIIWNISFKIF